MPRPSTLCRDDVRCHGVCCVGARWCAHAGVTSHTTLGFPRVLAQQSGQRRRRQRPYGAQQTPRGSPREPQRADSKRLADVAQSHGSQDALGRHREQEDGADHRHEERQRKRLGHARGLVARMRVEFGYPMLSKTVVARAHAQQLQIARRGRKAVGENNVQRARRRRNERNGFLRAERVSPAAARAKTVASRTTEGNSPDTTPLRWPGLALRYGAASTATKS